MSNTSCCYNTELSDRILWYDGESSYNPDMIIPAITKGQDVRWVTQLTPDVVECNRLSPITHQIGVKYNSDNLSMGWNIPIEYQQLNIISHIIDRHNTLTDNLPEDECVLRDERLADELLRFRELGLLPMLKTMVYITDRLAQENVVYGVGRGSSVSSYVLYIIGVHDVDSFKYELDYEDFLHE